MARCGACGRPYDGETLKTREIACQGCHTEYVALKAEITIDFEAMVDPETDESVQVEVGEHNTYTGDQALQIARNAHYAREQAAGEAERQVWLARNAQGRHAKRDEDLAEFTDANGKTVTVAEMKSRAQAKLDAMDGV